MITGYYYLHTNGELIYKKHIDGGQAADFRESSFVKAFWPVDEKSRLSFWTMLVESLSFGANKKRVDELAERSNCNDTDGHKYAEIVGVKLSEDGELWCATREDFDNLQESPAGFGDTVLEAIANLCKELGFKPNKLWGVSFADLVGMKQ